MSVINTMLRDLDQRRAELRLAEGGLLQSPELQPLGLAGHAQTGPRFAVRRLVPWLLASAVVLGLVYAWLTPSAHPGEQQVRLDHAAAPPENAQPTVPVPAVTIAHAAAAPPQHAQAAAPAKAELVSTSPDGASNRASAGAAKPSATPMELGLRLNSQVNAPVSKPAPVETHPAEPTTTLASSKPVGPDSASATQAPKASSTAGGAIPVTPVPAAATLSPTKHSASASTASEPMPTQRQNQAAHDALAQAQTLWVSGAQEAAIGTMQELLVTTERLATASPTDSNSQLLINVVRELTRMQMAMGRTAAAWELLSRLEPALNSQPDLWALRANAAQRLGRHQDSLNAYTAALQARPNEQRWLLGMAVSLAALGQTHDASTMTDKARQQGPIGKDIAAYLRQAGVIVNE
ncbi:hypothetical protein [Rhodoferax aquaticus]|uniref:Uncharacterized protein n=1 Tax=Rhodoferax aquaticus TaxID=2527691 RepID=A0A515EUV3_9BURK|nr:hypothetical protein [Rhodoferax aquaticus]QDL56454.1 hypothetical protein EXZ61_21110 [Rhodoferax aquaticus]